MYKDLADYSFSAAKEIVNQLSEQFCFDMKPAGDNVDFAPYDLAHSFVPLATPVCRKIIFQGAGELAGISNAYNPVEFFYAHDRVGELSVLTGGNLPEASADLCRLFNQYDVFVSDGEEKLLEALACGCFVICGSDQSSFMEQQKNGYVLAGNADEALKWCSTNLKFIRVAAREIAAKTFDAHRWEVIAPLYRKVYDTSLAKR
ncbi:hypothetical protein FACS1894139_15460 [Planctomycetales bacterium]|nr:hypothetical protein FACS1894107_16560 [Planctomycetales bacterium]GHT00628.1 hypothetical protein FACS1894108_13140 [Planctomycetales bacterium]GHT07338.1 hypothetical protein FACS1894139_15460 [Planctomycetales bacterium]